PQATTDSTIDTIDITILADQARDLAPREVGDIAIKGPNVMQGYFRHPEETAQILRDGLFLAGDIGQMDADGYFYLVDRAKDMINVSGFKVWPREVEEIIMKHPGVGEVAVIGIPDTNSGEAVKAFAVSKEGWRVTEQELIEFCRSRIAVYKAPRFFEFVDSLPRNPAGKILKRERRGRETEKTHATELRRYAD